MFELKPYYRVAISGTPIQNKVEDAYSVLKWLDVEKASLYWFKKQYCIYGGYGGHQLQGVQNMDKLREKIAGCSLRRLKKDCLGLPPKVRKVEYVNNYPSQQKLYNEIRAEIRSNLKELLQKMKLNPLTLLLRLRQVNGAPEILSDTVTDSAKMDRLEELVEEIIQTEGKVIVYSNWEEMLIPAARRLKQYNPLLYTGRLDMTTRQEYVNKFQTDPNTKVMLGTIKAMGTGITLTAAQNVIFLDRPWNPAWVEQAEDRTHRIGTTGTVTVSSLISKDTVDDRVEELIATKEDFSKALIDGEMERLDKYTVDQWEAIISKVLED
jgi:SNF2 family DNA or RNA helicase